MSSKSLNGGSRTGRVARHPTRVGCIGWPHRHHTPYTYIGPSAKTSRLLTLPVAPSKCGVLCGCADEPTLRRPLRCHSSTEPRPRFQSALLGRLKFSWTHVVQSRLVQ
jgi:hypothetical protein